MARYITTIDLSDSQGSEDVFPELPASFHINKPNKSVLGKRNHFDIDDSDDDDDYYSFCAAQRAVIDEAITLIAGICSQSTKEQIRQAVCNYCMSRKDVKMTPLDDIVNNVVDILFNGSNSTPVVTPAPAKSAPIQPPKPPPPVPVVLSPLQEVLCVFPDAKESFVEELLGEHGNAATVIQRMAETGYDKKEKVASTTKEETKDFKSKSWETSAQYRHDALLCLYADFPYLLKTYIKKEFMAASQHYYHTVTALREALGVRPVIYPLSWQERCKLNTIMKEKRADWVAKGIRVASALPKLEDINTDGMDIVLLQELAWLRTEMHREQEDEDRQAAERLNEEIAAAEGGLMECGCCYSEAPFEKMVQCSEGHLFCKTCLQHYAEQTLFGDGKTSLKCMNSSDNCEGFFAESFLASSLSAKVFAKYQEAVAIEVVKAAKLQLVECYDCKFSVEMGEDSGNILTCPQCGKQTCKLCGEVEHIPLKCSEVEKKGATDARLTVEEAMTKARLRECHKCKTRFFKTEGCNKMTCTCGAIICYLCRKDITKSGYKHFCQTPHCNHKTCGAETVLIVHCGIMNGIRACVLFSDAVEDDRRAMLDAGIKAKATAGEEVTVDVTKLLEGKTNGKAPMPIPMPAFQQGFGMEMFNPGMDMMLPQGMMRGGRRGRGRRR